MPGDERAEPALPAALAASTGYLLSKAAQRSIAAADGALRPLGIRPRHYGILAGLAEAGALSQQRLGEWLRVDRTTMVALVDDLERQGLVTRQRMPSDRRTYALELTAAGTALLARARELMAATDTETLAALSAAERRQLHALLELLV